MIKVWNPRTCEELGSVSVTPPGTSINDLAVNDRLAFTALEWTT